MNKTVWQIKYGFTITVASIVIFLLYSNTVQIQNSSTVVAQEQIQKSLQEASQDIIQESSADVILDPSPTIEQPKKRSTENPDDIQLIWSLLDERKEAYLKEKPRWETGITMEMVMASDAVIDLLKKQWTALAEFYPPKHFDNKTADEYMQEYIQYRFRFHYSLYEMEGPGSGGTIVKVIAGNNVISDLEDMIAQTVLALVGYSGEFDYETWKSRWDESF